MVARWLALCASVAGGTGLIIGAGTKILQVWQGGQKKNQLNSKTSKQKQESTAGPVKLFLCFLSLHRKVLDGFDFLKA